jgi:L-fuculose-phosphate aldolase
MIFSKEKALKKEIIEIGKRLAGLRLVVSREGNLSSRLDARHILVTATGTRLGGLNIEDIINVDLTREEDLKNKRLTSEFPLHHLIYKNLPAQVVIHCHPALTNAYFAVCANLEVLTFETKLYLGNVPIVEQETPAVTKPELVIEALKTSNLVVLKNHGVVAVGENFKEAFDLIETLEEAVRIAAVARLFKKENKDSLDKELTLDLEIGKAYAMFSREHIQKIVDLVNTDEFIQRKGQEQDLTLQYAIKLDGTEKAYKFNFVKGKIIRLDADAQAPFVASAPAQIWELIFLGKLDPFVAVTQGKMKLEGQLGQLSKWYVPFTRLFELFRQVQIK